MNSQIQDLVLKNLSNQQQFEFDELKTLIYKSLKSHFEDKKSFKKALKATLNQLNDDKTIEYTGDIIKLLKVNVEGVSSIKRKRETSNSESPNKKVDQITYPKPDDSDDDSIKNNVKYKDLWKNGEKYWKEGLFDQEYLSTNPDK